MNTSKIFIFVWLIFFLITCDEQDNEYVKERVPVRITEMDFPDQASAGAEVEGFLKAQAENACYSALEFTMTETADNHYTFTATALYESRGVCAEVLIEKDTTIVFTPPSAGKYYFQANESTPLRDTLVVN